MSKKIKILVTTTSFQDSYGSHHEFLKKQSWEIDFLRGPLKENELINIVQDYDGILCGDDEYTDDVLKKGADGNLKILSKYGVGLDKINLESAKAYNIEVRNCLGINQKSVAEHILALILTYEKNIHSQYNSVQNGSWKRLIGREVRGRTIGIIGLGAIGKELAILSSNFGLNVLVNDIEPDSKFLDNNKVLFESFENLLSKSDYVSLNVPLNENTKHLINKNSLKYFMEDSILINTARAEVVNKFDLISHLKNKKIRAYLCDVLENEPIIPSEELLGLPNVIISPHVGSRTKENIENQGIKSLENLKNFIEND